MIVNVFAYSEPYELDLLEIKFNLENSGVDKWVIVENDYSLRGKYKGKHTLNECLQQERFLKFRGKIEVIETSYYIDMQEGIDNFTVIHYQRNLQKQWLINNCNPNDWVIISDLDESIDFAEKKDYILNSLKPNELNKLIQTMYYLDFDNSGGVWDHSRAVQFKDIIGKYNNTNLQIFCSLKNSIPIDNTGYHYIFCMARENIWRKLTTYGHTNFKYENVESWCKYNHGGGDNILQTYRGKFHCETVELNEGNSSKFVRDNLYRFKTNSIDINYKQNRKEYWENLVL